MHDLDVTSKDLTPELLDRYPVVAATVGGASCVSLRSDRRLLAFYHRDSAAEMRSALPTLYILVADYEESTIAPLLKLVEESNARRLARSE